MNSLELDSDLVSSRRFLRAISILHSLLPVSAAVYYLLASLIRNLKKEEEDDDDGDDNNGTRANNNNKNKNKNASRDVTASSRPTAKTHNALTCAISLVLATYVSASSVCMG